MRYTKEDVVKEVREWLGTPYHHQGRLKGVGCDCAGIVIGVADRIGFKAKDMYGYSDSPNSTRLLELLASQGIRVPKERMQPGDVLLMRIRRDPQHLAILVNGPNGYNMVHSYSTIGRVVEHSLDDKWRKRIVAVFRFPGVE